jgi:hypothetical protein
MREEMLRKQAEEIKKQEEERQRILIEKLYSGKKKWNINK